MKIFIMIFLFFGIIMGSIWYGYQYFTKGNEISKIEMQRFVNFSIPASAKNLSFFSQKGLNQTIYIYFQLEPRDVDPFISTLPCQKPFDDVSYTSFIADFEKKGIIGEKNPEDRHSAFECIKDRKGYQVAIYPHEDFKNIYFKVFSL
jgi:hypothetical protein